MEEKKYGFNYDPNKVEKTVYDANGNFKMSIEGNEAPLNMPNNNVTLANRPAGKSRVKKMKPGNIGPGSNGFAGVAVLASIIAIAGAIIAYFTLKY